MKKRNILKWIILAIAIAINVFIIVNAFINGENSAKESNAVAKGVADVINTVKPETVTESNFGEFSFSIRKLFGHFGLFACSGVFSSWALYLFVKDTKVGYFACELGITIGFGFFLALLTEITQKFIPERTGSWTDVGIDTGGYLIGVLLVFLILLIRKSPIFHRKNQK